MTKHRVEKQQEDLRLDRFIHSLYSHRSRSSLQKMIERGLILVNGKHVKSHYFLREHDAITIEEENEKKKLIQPIPSFSMIDETNDYFIIDKQPGIVVHSSLHHQSGTLVDALLAYYPALRKVGDDPLRPGIVHRLDKDASGVMVIAKNQESFESLKIQFKMRTVKKQYCALLYGHIRPQEGTIRFSLGRSKKVRTKIASVKNGREALTNYWLENYVGTCSLVRAEPKTGRTHQIRVHFYSYGYPIVGDSIYQRKNIKRIDTPRLMLHAASLGFRDKNGILKEYISDLPRDFLEVIACLKKI